MDLVAENLDCEATSLDSRILQDVKSISEENHTVDVVGNADIKNEAIRVDDCIAIVTSTPSNNSESTGNLKVCTKCGFSSRNDELLQVHIKTHITAKETKSDFCDYKTLLNAEFYKHLATLKEGKKFKCNVCGFQGGTESLLETHLLTHKSLYINIQLKEYYKRKKSHPDFRDSSQKISDCALPAFENLLEPKIEICDARDNIPESNAQKSSKQKSNNEVEIEIKEYCCEVCGMLLTEKKSFDAHCKKHAVKKQQYCCDMCGQLFTKKSSFYAHYSTHTIEQPPACSLCDYNTTIGEKLFKCFNCSEVFRCNSCLAFHKAKHMEEKRNLCEICGTMCKNSYLLKLHYINHTGERPFACGVCEYKSKTSQCLQLHNIQVHAKEKKFKCEICARSFALFRSFSLHREIHTGIKKFSCSICNTKFRYKRTLKNHLLIHSGEKPFQCRICDYRCTTKTLLTQHTRKHTGVKPFKCDVCDYTAAYSSSMYKHKQKHINSSSFKKFKCEKCNFRTVLKGNLRKHNIRVHTGEKPARISKQAGEKPFHCNLCDYKCTKRLYLNKHQLKHSSNKK